MIFNSIGGKGTYPGTEVVALIHSVRKAVPFKIGKRHGNRDINCSVKTSNSIRPQSTISNHGPSNGFYGPITHTPTILKGHQNAEGNYKLMQVHGPYILSRNVCFSKHECRSQ